MFDRTGGSGGLGERYADVLVERRRAVILSLLLVTLCLGSGVVLIGDGIELRTFEVSSDEAEAMETIDATFERDDHQTTQIVVRGEETLTRESLLETMALQRELRANETVNRTLADDRSTAGVGNAMAVAIQPRLVNADGDTIDEEFETLAERLPDRLDRDFEVALATTDFVPDGQPEVTTLLPTDADLEDRSADARLVVVVHDEDADDEAVLEAQYAIDDLVDDRIETTDAFVFGQELAFDRGADATSESFGLAGPLALVLVGMFLAVAYRDPLEVVLGFVGIALVLVWTAGALGWTGIGFNQLLVAVPCLLVGLGVDHALHVTMRRREQRPGTDLDERTRIGLASVIVPIALTTVTTVAGFLSGLVSPIGLLREFALASAIGILSAFVVFGALLPALRLELEGLLDRRDGVRWRRPVGRLPTVTRSLRSGVTVARTAPVVLVLLALVLSLGGVYGLAHADTSSERTDFLPDQPDWTKELPEPIRPTDYGLQEQATYLEATFDGHDERTVEVLVDGDVTDPATLEAINESERRAHEEFTLGTPGTDRSAVYTPLDALEAIAAENETVAETLEEADTSGDGVPDTDLEAVYDVASEADPDRMDEVVSRTADGEYDALRMSVTVEEIDEPETVVAPIDSRPSLTAVATGEPVLDEQRDRVIVETVFGTFAVAVVVIAVVLTAAFYLRHGSWTLGPITIAPVLAALAWTGGTMTLLSIPYNAETAIIAGIGVGLGVDYAVHVTERYCQERQNGTGQEALEAAVVETGATVLASGATTAVGFAALTVTAVPSLRRFGIVTALVVCYAFLTTVVVLPGLLTLWDRS